MGIDYETAGRVDMLKRRVKRCVCRNCGKPLTLKCITFSEIDEARTEIFCSYCNKIEFGVEPEIYQCAKYFVEEIGFNYFPDLDQNEKTKRMNVAKICEIMAWENKNLGILDKDGFKVALDFNENMIGERVILTDRDLDELENNYKKPSGADRDQSR